MVETLRPNKVFSTNDFAKLKSFYPSNLKLSQIQVKAQLHPILSYIFTNYETYFKRTKQNRKTISTLPWSVKKFEQGTRRENNQDLQNLRNEWQRDI